MKHDFALKIVLALLCESRISILSNSSGFSTLRIASGRIKLRWGCAHDFQEYRDVLGVALFYAE